MNVKNIILVIIKLSNNADSYDQGEGQQLYDIVTCFHE